MVLKVTQIEPEGIFCETGSEIFTTGNGSYGSFMCFNALKGFYVLKSVKNHLFVHK